MSLVETRTRSKSCCLLHCQQPACSSSSVAFRRGKSAAVMTQCISIPQLKLVQGCWPMGDVHTTERRALDLGERVDDRCSGNTTKDAISLASIQAAAIRIAQYVHRTPVMTCESMDALASCGTAECRGRKLFFKCELFQKTGSFKARGACNATLLLPRGVQAVVTHSSGNHALALAWAASVRGVAAHCVMPNDASTAKVARVADCGAEVVLCAPSYRARVSTADALVREHSAVLVHSSNDADVINGQVRL
jgi:cysteine synthase